MRMTHPAFWLMACLRRTSVFAAGGNLIYFAQAFYLKYHRVRPPPAARTKKKDTTFVVSFFLERVTRLELATSTLARWRSTR